MPVAVVERLQLVDVDEGEDETAVAPARAVDLVLERDLAHLAPQRAGEVVVVGVAELDGGARAILGRRGTVGGGARTIRGRAGAVVRRSRAQRRQALCRGLLRAVRRGGGLEGLGGLVALHRGMVAGARRHVALVGGPEALRRRARTLRGRHEPLVGGLAPVRRGGAVVRRVPSVVPLAVRRGLIEVRSLLVPVGIGLVAVGTRLVAVGERLVGVRQRLIAQDLGVRCVLPGAAIAGGAGAFALGHGEPLSWSCRPRKPGGTPFFGVLGACSPPDVLNIGQESYNNGEIRLAGVPVA